jgi:hypothetical protein
MRLGEIAGVIRKYAYGPDGKPPEGWDIAQDLSIVKVMRKAHQSDEEIAATIKGVALMRDRGDISWIPPRAKFTLKAVYKSRYGNVSLLYAAKDAWYQYEKKRPKSNVPRLGKIMREIMETA